MGEHDNPEQRGMEEGERFHKDFKVGSIQVAGIAKGPGPGGGNNARKGPTWGWARRVPEQLGGQGGCSGDSEVPGTGRA